MVTFISVKNGSNFGLKSNKVTTLEMRAAIILNSASKLNGRGTTGSMLCSAEGATVKMKTVRPLLERKEKVP